MLIFAQDQTISLRNIHSSTITPTSYTKTSLKLVRLQPRNARTKLAEYRETRSSHTRYREFSKGDKVLILLPQNGNNLFMRYQGPYSIQKVANDNNYVCQIGKKLKTYHANLLKKFEERQPLPPHDIILPHAAVSFIKEDLKKHLYRSQYCKYPTCPNRLLYSPTLQIKH